MRKIKKGDSNIVCKKKVSNWDWWVQAIKNLLLLSIFSRPLTIIFVDKNILKQNFAQYPDSLPPNDAILLGIINAGKKIIHIKTKPK